MHLSPIQRVRLNITFSIERGLIIEEEIKISGEALRIETERLRDELAAA